MPLYEVLDEEGNSRFVVATTMAAALRKWTVGVASETDEKPSEVKEPLGIERVADDTDIMLEDTWLA